MRQSGGLLCAKRAHGRVERVDRDQADRRVGRAVGDRRDIALADVGGQLDVQGRAVVVADDEVGIGDLDVGGPGSAFAEPGRLFSCYRLWIECTVTVIPPNSRTVIRGSRGHSRRCRCRRS